MFRLVISMKERVITKDFEKYTRIIEINTDFDVVIHIHITA